MPLTKSIALEVAEAEELDRNCSNKYHPQKWRPAVVGTEVIPVVTQPIDPQLLVLKWFLWSRNLLTPAIGTEVIPVVTQPPHFYGSDATPKYYSRSHPTSITIAELTNATFWKKKKEPISIQWKSSQDY